MPVGATVAARLWLALTALLMAGLAVLVVALEDTRATAEAELRQARFAYTAVTLKTTVETALGLGLPLATLDAVQTVIDETIARDPHLLSIDVFAADGRLLFTTDSVGIRNRVPESWQRALETERTAGGAPAPWRIAERGVEAIGIGLDNAFGVVIGGIALRHAPDGPALLGTRLDRLPIAALLLIVAAGVLIGLLLLTAVLRREERLFDALADAAAPGTDAAPRLTAGSLPDTAIAAALVGFRGRCQAIEERLGAAEAEIARLDRLE